MKATKKPVEIDYFPLSFNCISDLQKWVESLGDKFSDQNITTPITCKQQQSKRLKK